MRLCAVSVDLDEIPNYFQIHGLPVPSGAGSTAVYDLALDRLVTMASDASLPLTLFAIGSDLVRPEAARGLSAARAKGHEIANHSLDHRYDLVRLERAAIREQVVKGIEAIENATGERPVGFRAPGYTITDTVFEVLTELGVAYDSVVDRPTVLLAPTSPYRIGRPYWQRGKGMLELPVQVTRGLRLPFIGTTVTLAGPTRARWLARMCVGAPLVNLELHGIDVLDAADGLEALRAHQPDVRVTKEAKLEALHAAYDVLRKAGYAFVTMREAAEQVGKSLS